MSHWFQSFFAIPFFWLCSVVCFRLRRQSRACTARQTSSSEVTPVAGGISRRCRLFRKQAAAHVER